MGLGLNGWESYTNVTLTISLVAIWHPKRSWINLRWIRILFQCANYDLFHLYFSRFYRYFGHKNTLQMSVTCVSYMQWFRRSKAILGMLQLNFYWVGQLTCNSSGIGLVFSQMFPFGRLFCKKQALAMGKVTLTYLCDQINGIWCSMNGWDWY